MSILFVTVPAQIVLIVVGMVYFYRSLAFEERTARNLGIAFVCGAGSIALWFVNRLIINGG